MDIIPKKFILNNGLRVIFLKSLDSQNKKANKTVYATMYIGAGSNNETIKNNGISHFYEHLVFRGTKNRKGIKLLKELDSLGLTHNGHTSKNYTSYYITTDLNSNKRKNIEFKLIELLVDFITNTHITQEIIDKEVNVVIQEISSYLDNPSVFIESKMNSKLFSHSSGGLDPAGTEKGIKKLTVSDFINFRKQFYNPSNAILVISGPMDYKKIFNFLEKIFNSSKYKWNDYSDEYKILKTITYYEQKRPYVYLNNHDIFETRVIVAFKITVNDYYEGITSIANILTNGLSSRLYIALRHKTGKIYNINYFFSGEGMMQYLCFSYGTINKNVTETIKIILKEVSSLKNTITNKEVELECKTNIEDFLKNFKSVEQLCIYYAKYYIDNKSCFLKDKASLVKQNYERIKNYELNISDRKKYLKSISKNLFALNNLNIFIYGETKGFKKFLKHTNLETLL